MLVDHLEKLKYFKSVATHGSLNKASVELHMTQPSLSKSIKVLEESLQTKLFDRTPSGMKLTIDGKNLLDSCIELFSLVEVTQDKIDQKTDVMDTTINLGTYDSIAVYLIPSFLKKLKSRYPQLRVNLVTGRSHYIDSLLDRGEIDLAITVSPQENRLKKIQTLKWDNLNYYICKKESERPIDELNRPSLIYMEDSLNSLSSTNRLQVREFFKDCNYETSSLETAKVLAESGLGIAILPGEVGDASTKLEKVKNKKLPSIKLSKHQISISYFKYKDESLLYKNIIEVLKNSTKKK